MVWRQCWPVVLLPVVSLVSAIGMLSAPIYIFMLILMPNHLCSIKNNVYISDVQAELGLNGLSFCRLRLEEMASLAQAQK